MNKVKLLTTNSLFFLLLFFITNSTFCQPNYLIENIENQLLEYREDVLNERNTIVGYTIGLSMDIGRKRNGSLRAYANVGVVQKLNKGDFNALIAAQSHIEFYRGGLGTSLLNSEKFKINIELRNSIVGLFGWEANNTPVSKPLFVNVGSDASSLHDPLDYSFSLGTIFINGLNHSRHQRIGSLSFSINQFSFHYYNDGPPFDLLMLGDTYDRYWTGGGQLGFYFNNDDTFLTSFLMRYDNYTGYQLNLYEVGSMLNIDQLPYLSKEQQMFNQARFQYKFGIKNSIFINGSVFEPIVTDIQNYIHYHISISPFHARPLGRRLTFGLEYDYDFKFN